MSESTRSDDLPEKPHTRRSKDISVPEPEHTAKPAKTMRPESQWGARVLVLLCGLVAASSSVAFAHFWHEDRRQRKRLLFAIHFSPDGFKVKFATTPTRSVTFPT